MNCVLFAKMDEVFSLKKTLKNNGKMEKHSGKVGEFCQSGKVGTMKELREIGDYTLVRCVAREFVSSKFVSKRNRSSTCCLFS